MKNLLLAAIAGAALMGGAANAATVFATNATIVKDGPRGTADNRNVIGNALGSTMGDFFELGLGAIVDFTFGQNFTGPGNVVEVTFNTVSNHPESADIFLGSGGTFTKLTSISNVQAQGPSGASFDFAGVFDTLRLVDTTARRGQSTGGFDVDVISVAAVPLPASGLLLLAGMGGLGALRRRRKAA